MERRAFLAGTAALLTTPLVAGAQQAGKTYRLGWLTPTRPAPGHRVLVGSLSDLGYAEDKNLSIETRYADGQTERYPALAAELVALKVDVLVAQGNTAAIPASRATATIPIVMIGGIDPVGAGLAASLARPGGNVTGLLQDVGQDVVVKQLEILRQLLPAVVRVAVLMGPHQTSIDALPALEAAAPTLGMTLHPVLIHGPQDIDRAFATMIRNRADALVVLSNPIINDRPQPVVELAARHRIPAGYWWTGMVDRFGGLFSYGVAWADLYRRAATYIDKILKGAKPADLPIEQPIKFELVINLKTAKALGVTVPPSTLLRADRVIE